MSSLSEVIAGHSPATDDSGDADLTASDIEWLHLLIGDWQVIADLAFADLVLWLPLDDGTQFVALAQCRPSNAPTVNYDDIVGTYAPDDLLDQLRAAYYSGELQPASAPKWFGTYSVSEDAVPVVHGDRTIAVIARSINLGSGQPSWRRDKASIESADDLLGMIARGEYPIPGAALGQHRGAPRVGDGLIRLNADGEVLFASPNALSCFHRLGILGPLIGQSLVEMTSSWLENASTVDEAMPLVLMGRAPWRTDIETTRASLSIRAIPLTENGDRIGAVLLCRDISELRRRERDLMTREATIREIHHRVKNNLATVAALLRLQGRRVDNGAAQEALQEATRRVTTISMVHEFLSQTLDEQVEADDMMQRALRMAIEVSATPTNVTLVQRGSFGLIPAENASSLALVLTELVTNAVEHGFGDLRSEGTVWIDVQRDGQSLQVVVADDGIGPEDAGEAVEPGALQHSGLGTQIVRALVENELAGSITWRPRPGGGTEVRINGILR